MAHLYLHLFKGEILSLFHSQYSGGDHRKDDNVFLETGFSFNGFNCI